MQLLKTTTVLYALFSVLWCFCCRQFPGMACSRHSFPLAGVFEGGSMVNLLL